jgi:hypothetical protein
MTPFSPSMLRSVGPLTSHPHSSGTLRAGWLRRLATVCALGALVLGPLAIGCGFQEAECTAEDACECSGAGACEGTCVGGDCDMFCDGAGACDFECEDGGCVAHCKGQGSCELSCPGGGCVLMCSGAGSCELKDCPEGQCELECNSVGSCEQS